MAVSVLLESFAIRLTAVVMGIIMAAIGHPSPTFPGTDDSCDSLRVVLLPLWVAEVVAAVGQNWVERSDGTMEELGSTATVEMQPRDVL